MEPLKFAEDAREAINWYLRLLFLQELERGVLQVEFALKSGLQPSRLSVLKRDATGAGVDLLMGFARYYGRQPGALLDESITWWERRGGREMTRAVQAQLEQERRQPHGRRRRRPISSEFPSPVRLLRATPHKLTGSHDPPPSSKKK